MSTTVGRDKVSRPSGCYRSCPIETHRAATLLQEADSPALEGLMRFKRSPGITPSERLLADLCDRSFLTLWSYPNLFRAPAKELCDVLVVFGDDVVIFSDKSCTYPSTGNDQLDWGRWFHRSLTNSARQLTRAENWLKKHPDRIFMDAKCAKALPIQLPPADRMRVHRVCVALGASERSKHLTGKTALTVSPGVEDDTQIFTVGRISEAQGWVHVFDENTLPIVIGELSTIADFLSYLQKKEVMFSSGQFSYAESDLDLLGYFLWNNREFPSPEKGMFKLLPNLWEQVESSPQFLAARQENSVSYFWDRLIEYLTGLFVKEELEIGNEMSVGDYEKVVRIMASESRFGRRILAKWILERVEPPEGTYAGSLSPSLQPEVTYVLLVGPGSDQHTHAEYRKARSEQLYLRCVAAKAVQPDRRYIIGIALDARHVRGHSEDFVYLDTEGWTPKNIKDAEQVGRKMGYFVKGKVRESRISESEYPNTIPS